MQTNANPEHNRMFQNQIVAVVLMLIASSAFRHTYGEGRASLMVVRSPVRGYPETDLGISSIGEPYCLLPFTQEQQDERRGTEAVPQRSHR